MKESYERSLADEEEEQRVYLRWRRNQRAVYAPHLDKGFKNHEFNYQYEKNKRLLAKALDPQMMGLVDIAKVRKDRESSQESKHSVGNYSAE